MKLLFTGFEPLDGSKINPSEQVIRALANENLGALKLSTAILPVDRVHGPAALIRAYQVDQPDPVLCLGEASRRMGISIERIAINLPNYRIADNAANQIVDEPIFQNATAVYFCALPLCAVLNAGRACGVPAELS